MSRIRREKHDIRKKTLSKCVTGIMASMLIVSAGMGVYANNSADTYDRAILEEASGNSPYYTAGRYKEDYTSGYARNISSSYGGNTYFTLVASDGDGSTNHYEDFRLWSVPLVPGQEGFITNLVKESGYNYAAVRVDPEISGYVNTYFAWSPDNYQGY